MRPPPAGDRRRGGVRRRDLSPSPALEAAAAAGIDPPDTATTTGASAVVSWQAAEALTPCARFEILGLDDDLDDDVTSLLLAGVNWQVGGGWS